MKGYFISGVVNNSTDLHLGFYALIRADLKETSLTELAWDVIKKRMPELEFVNDLTIHITAFNNIER